MKWSKLIKILICFAAVCILFCLFKNNAPANAVSKFSSKNEEYLKTGTDYENMSDNFKNAKHYQDKANKLLRDINAMNVLTDIKQEQIIGILNEHLSNCNVEASSIDFSEAIPVSLNNFNNDAMAQSEGIENEETIYEAVMIAVKIEFKSSYTDMLKFVDKLQTNSTDMVIRNMRIYSAQTDIVYGVMELDFYVVPMDVNV